MAGSGCLLAPFFVRAARRARAATTSRTATRRTSTAATCTGCAVGLMCQVDGDCASRGCDATSSSCAQTQCVDHHRDGLV